MAGSLEATRATRSETKRGMSKGFLDELIEQIAILQRWVENLYQDALRPFFLTRRSNRLH